MHIHELKVYSYDELDETIRNRLLAEKVLEVAEDYPDRDLTESFQDHLHTAGFYLHDVRWILAGQAWDGVAFFGQVDLDMLAAKQPLVYRTIMKAYMLTEYRDSDTELEGLERYGLFAHLPIPLHNKHSHNHNDVKVNISVDNYDNNPEILDPWGQPSPADIPWDGEGEPPENYGLTDVAHELTDIISKLCQKLAQEMEIAGLANIAANTGEEISLKLLLAQGEVFLADGSEIESPC